MLSSSRNALYLATSLALGVSFPSLDAAARSDATAVAVGSRVPRGADPLSDAIVVFERDDLARTGLTSLGDILQELAIGGRALNTRFNGGGDGTTAIDLRDLGTGRTLVLVNGRRWITNLAGFVDLNTIPLSIVERVEVLKEGASALYGSDAIAGVVNVTTRTRFDGAEASAWLGEFEQGDGRAEQYDFTIGSSTDRASVVLNASYTKAEPVSAGDRAISAVPLFGFSGNNVNVGASSTTPFGRFGFGNGNQLPNGANGTLTLIPGRTGAGAGDFQPFVAATSGYNFVPGNYLLTPQERHSVYASTRYRLTDAVSFRSEVVYNERRSAQQLSGLPLTLGTVGSGNTARSIVIPAGNVFNPFGATVTRIQFRNRTQPRRFEQDVDTFHFAAGFDGAFDLFDRTWAWSANYGYMDNEQNDVSVGQFDLSRLAAGLGPSFVDAQGVARCGTSGAVIAGCVPINVFGGPDGFTQAMVDYAGVTLQDTFYTERHGYTANVAGDLFELPAGPVGFAAGYEYRHEQGFDEPDALARSGALTAIGRQPLRGGYSLDEFHAAFNVPLLADAPLAESLAVSIAARQSDYSNFDATTNATFGVRWKPVADLLVRGNWGQGFHAPSIIDLFTGQSDSFPNVIDPCSPSNQAGANDPTLTANCIAAGRPPNVYDQGITQIRVTVGGNPNLEPEESIQRTLGLAWSPSWFEGLDVYLDWYNVEVTNTIGVADPQQILDDCYYRNRQSQCDLVTRAPTGDILDLFAGNANVPGGVETEGYDFVVRYGFDTAAGRFEIDWDSAYVAYFGEVGQPEGGNRVGVYGDRLNAAHRLKSTITTHWQRHDWGVSLAARYVSALDEDCTLPAAFGRPDFCSNPEGSPQFLFENRIDDTWYFDLQATWDAPWNGRVRAGVRNLADEDPPISRATFDGNFDPAYEIPGRFWYVGYTQAF